MNNFFNNERNNNMNSKEYINNYLTNVRKVREIDFEDIHFVANNICKDIITSAIESSDMTVDGLCKSLANVNAEDVALFFHEGGVEINCILKYIPTGEYVLSRPYMCQMTISVGVDGEISVFYGCSAFEFIIDNQRCMYDTSMIYEFYIQNPELFDCEIYCNL